MASSSKLSGLNWLSGLPPWDGVNYTPLSFTKVLLEKLGNPQNSYRTIHIAGTNGKGTVASLLNHILVKTGYAPQVGLMSSPHIYEANERCLINSAPISNSELDRALLKVQECCLQMETMPTFFVAITAAIFKIFAEQKVDLAIIEVGLGGRFDATNLIQASEMAIITSIGLDHQEQLGTSLNEIALNKAGIIKNNSKLILGDLAKDAKDIVLREAELKGTNVLFAENLSSRVVELFGDKFIPRFFSENIKIVLSCLDHLDLKPTNLPEILSDYYWPRRFNIWGKKSDSGGSCFIVDGAHNPPGVEMFLEDLLRFNNSQQEFKKVQLLFGFLKRKEWSQSANIIRRFLREHKNIQISCAAICIDPEFVSFEEYAKFFKCEFITTTTELRQFIAKASLNKNLVAVFGSLKLPHEIEDQLEKEHFKKNSFLN